MDSTVTPRGPEPAVKRPQRRIAAKALARKIARQEPGTRPERRRLARAKAWASLRQEPKRWGSR